MTEPFEFAGQIGSRRAVLVESMLSKMRRNLLFVVLSQSRTLFRIRIAPIIAPDETELVGEFRCGVRNLGLASSRNPRDNLVLARSCVCIL